MLLEEEGEVVLELVVIQMLVVQEVQEEGKAGETAEAEGHHHREASDLREGLQLEDVVDRGHHERAGDQPRDVGVGHDHQRPRDLRFIVIDEVVERVVGQFVVHQMVSRGIST